MHFLSHGSSGLSSGPSPICFHAPLPNPESSAAAAAMIVNYSTALYGLRDCGQVVSNERVLVLGAGGGVDDGDFEGIRPEVDHGEQGHVRKADRA